MEAAFTQPQQVGHVHKTSCSTTDPVGVFFRKSLHSRNDQATLGGVIRHVGGHQAPATGQLPRLLQSEAVPAHQHFQTAIAAQPVDHPDPGQVITNALAHADAVSTLVAVGGSVQVVVNTV